MNLSAYIAIHWKRPLKLLLLVVFFSLSLSGWTQIIGDSTFYEPHRILKEMPKADQLAIDSEGNLILLNRDLSCLYKYFVMTDFDSSIVVGGKSHRSEGFLHPVKISAGNRQLIYLLDDVKRKLLLLNTNLKVVEEIDFLDLGPNADRLTEGVPIFPMSFDVAPTGAIFVLSQEDNKIYKFDIFGNLESQFAGLDYGEGALYQPSQLMITDKIEILLSDLETAELKVYDLYGNYKFSIQPKVDFEWDRFALFGQNLILFNDHQLYFEQFNRDEHFQIELDPDKALIDIQLTPYYIYLLYENEVHLYRY